MYRTDFCEIGLLKRLIVSKRQWPNIIINTTTPSEYRDNIDGTLTIFSNISGEAYYGADNERKRVGDDTYFISNERQLYSIDISSRVETFNIHFSTSMLGGMLSVIERGDEWLLDDPDRQSDKPCNFYNRRYWKDAFFRNTTALLKERHSLGILDSLQTEEILARLLQHMLFQHKGIVDSVKTLKITKAATRMELYSRLSLAVDYIHEQYAWAISLDELAAVACMSKFHFLRTFKQVFRLTPYQYITSIRLDKARLLLTSTHFSVAEISLLVGYEDSSTFCRAFKGKVGYWPLEYRLQTN